MLSVGVDFGSTYTMVSVYRPDVDRAETVALTEDAGSSAVPTVLATAKGRVYIGREAKRKKPPAVCYRAFKMMLAEDNKDLLRSRGFDEKNTPTVITEKFLNSVLSQVLEREGEKEITHLSIGVPEIWTREMEEIEENGQKYSRFSSNVDGRAKLRDICKKLPMVKSDDSVQVVSEPVSASAFFAYDFYKKTGKNFNGHILLIDYGGGTLDITLTEISPKAYGDGSVGMEVRAPFRTGAGENRERGKIGRAGIVYMETLMRTAIKKTVPGIKEVPNDPIFYRAVDELEEAIMTGKSELDCVFSSVGADPNLLSEEDMEDAGEEFIFTEIRYDKEDIPISYQMMAEVYNSVIKPVFNEKMDEAIAYMNSSDHKIEYDERNVDKFKIVLAGGFGNFYLVKKQVADKFRFSSKDKRKEYVLGNTSDGEKAVSMGAALIAADKIRIRNTAPFSIGVAVSVNGKYSKTFGLRYNQDIVFDEEYIQKDASGNYQTIVSRGGYIDKLLINMQEDDRATLVMTPKPEFTKKLSRAVKNPSQAAVAGFSLDQSGVISLHIHELDIVENIVSKERHTVELTSFNELFGVQQMERAFPND